MAHFSLLKKYPSRLITVLGLFIILSFNGAVLKTSLVKIIKFRNMIPLLFQGQVFEELKQPLAGVAYIGYITDRDINDPEANKRFSQAQYILAPTILDPDKSDYGYLLLDCSSLSALKQKSAEFNIEPVKAIGNATLLAKRIK